MVHIFGIPYQLRTFAATYYDGADDPDFVPLDVQERCLVDIFEHVLYGNNSIACLHAFFKSLKRVDEDKEYATRMLKATAIAMVSVLSAANIRPNNIESYHIEVVSDYAWMLEIPSAVTNDSYHGMVELFLQQSIVSSSSIISPAIKDSVLGTLDAAVTYASMPTITQILPGDLIWEKQAKLWARTPEVRYIARSKVPYGVDVDGRRVEVYLDGFKIDDGDINGEQ